MTLLHDFETVQAGLFTEADLLGPEASPDDASSQTNTHDHAVVTAPILTGDALDLLSTATFPQRALYGRVVSQHGNGVPARPENSRLFINTNAPFSALVCGVQGSGKSHSTSVLLESVLIQNERLGQLPEPLSAIVFHLDSAAGGGMVQPCEAAYLASNDRNRGSDIQAPPVTVLVLPNNLRSMRMVYAGLPGVCVEPLHFASRDISGERLLSMMKVDESTQMPLYMEAIMNILRKMNDCFDYAAFRQQLEAQKFNTGQKAMLNLRLSLLDSCLEGGTAENSINTHFRKGQLTIIDLSSPFMDGSSACGFFDIILGLFVEADIQGSGKIVVLDEAHKYLSDQGASSRLTDSLLTVIRQQRHLATRVVISTQEPTVVPEKFIDLCSFVIAHRFSSPTWLKHLLQHISASDDSSKELWDKILSLNTGHAILFSPNGLCVKFSDENHEPRVSSLGQGYLTVRSRLRVTRDGGHSLLAVQDAQHSTRLGRVQASATVSSDPFSSHNGPSLRDLPPAHAVQTNSHHHVDTNAFRPVAGPTFPTDAADAAGGPLHESTLSASQTSATPSGHVHVPSLNPISVHPEVHAQFIPLLEIMRSRRELGMTIVSFDDLGTSFKDRNIYLTPRKIQVLARRAVAAGLVTYAGSKRVRLPEEPVRQPAAYTVGHVPSHPSENVQEPVRVNDGEDAGSEALQLAPASDSVDEALPSLESVIQSMVRAHRRGYTRVAYSFLCSQVVGHGVTSDGKPFSRPADLYARLERGIEDGQLVSLIEDGDSYVILPEDSPHRRPVTRELPGVDEGEFGRLLAHLRTRAPISWKSLQWQLQSHTPDAPYGQKAAKVNDAIKRAHEAGVIQVEGTGRGSKAMITVPNQEDTLWT